MIKVSEMNNEKLCEAISELREPKPQERGNVFPTWNTDSEQFNWIWKVDVNANNEHGYWKQLNWLTAENWKGLKGWRQKKIWTK